MPTHGFSSLNPGSWLGEGTIHLNMIDEELGFFTRWNVAQKDGGGKIQCTQEIQVKGLSDMMINQFSFFDLSASQFILELENHALGCVAGSGLLTLKVIAWEFRILDIGFEGFEFYELQSDNSYLMRAEYSTNDEFRTIIQGKVWEKKV